MTITTHYCFTQFCFCPFDFPLAQQFYRLGFPQSINMVFLQAGWRIFTGSLREKAAGKQDVAGTLLTVDGIKPFSNAWTVRKWLTCVPVEQVLKLVQDHQPGLIYRIKGIEEPRCLVLRR